MNSQLAIALHVMGVLASRNGEPVTSEALAKTYGTSPVVLRRVLSKLQRAGLINTRRGVGGGAVLARMASSINLREVFGAVADNPQLLRRHPGAGSGGVAPVLAQYVNELYVEAERALLHTLESVTVATMDDAVRSRLFAAASNASPDALTAS